MFSVDFIVFEFHIWFYLYIKKKVSHMVPLLCISLSTFGMYLILGWKPLCLLFCQLIK